MIDHATYYWSPEKGLIKVTDDLEYLPNLFCVDTNFNSSFRYGKYDDKANWTYVPKLNFPPAFQATLKLLNID